MFEKSFGPSPQIAFLKEGRQIFVKLTLCLNKELFSPHPGCRDLVHRQTASAVVQHMSLGVYGFGCEDSLNHLLNYVWPNVFETSPHVIQAVMGALEGLRVAIGPCRMLQYCLQVKLRF